MDEILEYLPDEYFEVKMDNLFYHPPEDAEEFLKHYELYRPVRVWVEESLEEMGAETNRYSVLGVWADSGNTIKFTGRIFEMVIF